MDSQKLKHLLAVVEHGTFSDAARAVHLTQPALSRSIRALEDELKAQLFDRGARRARLTVFGEVVAERARRIRLEMTQLQRDMELLRGAKEGHLNVGFAPGPAALLLTPFLIHMAQQHPAIKVRTELGATTALLERLRSESIDAIVGDSYILNSANDVEVEPLGHLAAGMVCRAGHPILRHKRVDFDTLRQYPLATTTLSTAITRRLTDLWGPEAEQDKLFTLHCNDLDTLRSVTLASDALLFGILAITRRERANGTIAEVPIAIDPHRYGRYGIARIATRTLSPALDVLYAFTRESWGEMEED
ncbi:LysR family transcriptional regulator [Diaphorobacter caeni]|uniref:LysR family transcriptional regulator n=1 Tax=Diaphorobacter caeni TaxID=2784387 RepID=UPI00188FFC80|nr:LysR family transcriptional regulator [Diaphorobacter caeni]MBF5003159.1 LysR family transcriptional regulator [Diaphorobacter caeni]